MFANVDNRLVSHTRSRGGPRSIPVVVPTMLFTLMRETFKVPVEDEVSMYLVRDGEHYVFGIAWGTAEANVADLWYYTDTSVPSFLK